MVALFVLVLPFSIRPRIVRWFENEKGGDNGEAVSDRKVTRRHGEVLLPQSGQFRTNLSAQAA